MKTNLQIWFFGAVLMINASCKSSEKLFLRGAPPTNIYTDSTSFTRQIKLVFVPVIINGKKYNFLLDTGAPMVVSKELAAELNLKRVARKHVGDSQGNRQKLNYLLLPQISLGNQTFANLVAIEADLNLDPTLACLKMDGIIGSNLLRHAIWEINSQTKTLSFHNNFAGFVPDSQALVMPFTTKATFTPVVDLLVDSINIGKITFDTGSSSTLSMPASRLGKPRLTPDSVITNIGFLSSGLFGSVADTVYFVQKNISINQTTFENVPITLERSKPKSLLGMGFLEGFVVVMNWQTKEMYLTPNEQNYARKSYSLSPRFIDDTLRVGSLVYNGEAMMAGIQLNDRILKINDFDTRQPSKEDYCQVLRIFRENEEITVQIEGRGEFVLKKVSH